MVEDNQEIEPVETPIDDEEYLRRQKNKTEALMRYINDQVALQKPKPVKNKTTKEKVKEAVVGIATIFYMMFAELFSDKKFRYQIGFRVLVLILIYLFAYWMQSNVFGEYEREKAAENYPQDVTYKANQARSQQAPLNTSGSRPN